MDGVLEQLNTRPQWSKTTGKGVRYAVLDYAPGDVIATPVNSKDFIHYHSYSAQYIMQTIAPESKGYGINVIGKAGEGAWSIEKGLQWCFENNIDVINMSLSWVRTQEISEVIQKLVANGVIICASTGNDGKSKINFPANEPGVISVGAYYLSNGKVTEYSNAGEGIEVIAPTNVDIPHWIKGKADINFSGTSCASPCVAGSALLWKEIYPEGNSNDFVDFIKAYAVDYGEKGYDLKSGYGKFRFANPETWIREVGGMIPEYIVVHHSATEQGGVDSFRRSHMAKGWRDVGYHYVIGNGTQSGDGEVEKGRPENEQGAHTQADNMNSKSLGICLVGNFQTQKPTAKQIESAKRLVLSLMDKYKIPYTRVLGHGEVQGAATNCPGKNFNMQEFRMMLKEKETNHVGRFKDVDAKKWYAQVIERAAELGLMNGTSADKFEPEKLLTRAELAAVAVRIYEKLSK